MVAVTLIACVLAGMFAGYATHQRQWILNQEDELRDLHDTVLRLNEELTKARCDAEAHATNLEMVLREVSR